MIAYFELVDTLFFFPGFVTFLVTSANQMVRHLLPSPKYEQRSLELQKHCFIFSQFCNPSDVSFSSSLLLVVLVSLYCKLCVLWYCRPNFVLFSYCSVVITITCTNIYVFFYKIVSTAKEKERKKGSNLSSYMLSCCVFVFLIVVVFCVYCKKLFYPTIISISFNLTIQSSFSFLIESYL